MNEPSNYNRAAAIAFFLDHAGYSVAQGETKAQGKQRSAETLADARLWAFQNSYSYEWELDDITSEDHSDEEPFYRLWRVAMHDKDGKIVQSLGGVDFGRDIEPWGQPYRVVVEAELAAEEKPSEPVPMIKILSIDAWRDGSGWQWNNWHKIGECVITVCDRKPRDLLRYMRAAGYLAHTSAGRVAVEDDGYNVVIVARGTREPLFALEYGAVQS